MGAHDLPADYARAEALASSMWAEFFRPPANQTVSEWADANRQLSGKSSSEPGPWRTDRTPYLRQIMDDLSARSTVPERAMPVTPVCMTDGISAKVIPPIATIGRLILSARI